MAQGIRNEQIIYFRFKVHNNLCKLAFTYDH